MSKKEKKSNIRFMCEAHAPKPNPKYVEMEPELFIGKNVKMAFPTENENFPVEHMWVKVNEVVEEDGQKILLGRIDSEPLYAKKYYNGCGVAFRLMNIEDVYEPPEESKKSLH